ncbi:hypothetical protein E1287_07145 [Actinomadura sp. KC06]|uniref:hypothetical protein n=1 Tax=Actinomadura sp. KC06 TaxID=2530369 RepID=UPI00104ABDBD|nr:hypothetical protein [Actinomadura sp. KC06]TDD37829.1 hypothetical protein E1287_07145 [Actinomadura sp. KC06]
MNWRTFLLPIVAAACGGLLLVPQISTQDVDLNTTGLSTEEEGAYLGWARTEAPELWAASDAQLLRIGLGLCAAIDRVPDPVVEPRPVEGLTGREIHAITNAATQHLCPTLRPKVAGYLRSAL